MGLNRLTTLQNSKEAQMNSEKVTNFELGKGLDE